VVHGPTSRKVVENVKRLRAERRWSLVELSEEMGQAGRPILSSGLHRLERGKRRVDVDDLVALARVFAVNVTELLGTDPPSIAALPNMPVCSGCGLVVGDPSRHATACFATAS
jgi:transcriptional regulator with XRE-family HTH domain